MRIRLLRLSDGVYGDGKPQVNLCCLWNCCFRFACASKDIRGLRLFCTGLQTSCFPLPCWSAFVRCCSQFSCNVLLQCSGTAFACLSAAVEPHGSAQTMCVPRTAVFPRSHASLPATRVNFTTTQICPCVQIGQEPSSDSEIAHIFSPN